MCYEYDTDAVILKPSHKLKELLNLFIVQRRGGLIEYQDFTFHIYSPCYGNHLLDCKGIIFKILCYVYADPKVVHNFLGSDVIRLAVYGL